MYIVIYEGFTHWLYCILNYHLVYCCVYIWLISIYSDVVGLAYVPDSCIASVAKNISMNFTHVCYAYWDTIKFPYCLALYILVFGCISHCYYSDSDATRTQPLLSFVQLSLNTYCLCNLGVHRMNYYCPLTCQAHIYKKIFGKLCLKLSYRSVLAFLNAMPGFYFLVLIFKVILKRF